MRSDTENTSSKSAQNLESSLSEFLPNSEHIWSTLAILFPEEESEKETRYSIYRQKYSTFSSFSTHEQIHKKYYLQVL